MRHRVTSAPDERRMEFIHQLTQREADNQTSEALPKDDQGVFLFSIYPNHDVFRGILILPSSSSLVPWDHNQINNNFI